MTNKEKADFYLEKCLRYARVIRDIQGVLAYKGYDVEHKEPEILAEVIMENMKRESDDV